MAKVNFKNQSEKAAFLSFIVLRIRKPGNQGTSLKE